MAYRIKNLQMQVPGGYQFIQPETGFQAPRYSSFRSLVQNVMAHRRANPFLAKKHGWATDEDGVAADVEAYNVKICEQQGWFDYLMGGDGAPLGKNQPLPPSRSGRLENVVAGANVLVDWLASGAEAAPAEKANARALVCTTCPLNQSGDMTSFFTVPVASAIRQVLNLKSKWNLSTEHDGSLGVCAACSCPLKLKVWLQLANILSRMSAETKGNLAPQCWITAEQNVTPG